MSTRVRLQIDGTVANFNMYFTTVLYAFEGHFMPQPCFNCGFQARTAVAACDYP